MRITGRGMTLYGEEGSSPPLPYIEVSDAEALVLLALDPKRIVVVADEEAGSEEIEQAEQAARIEAERQAEAERLAETERAAEAERLAEAERAAEAERQAEAERLAQEEAAQTASEQSGNGAEDTPADEANTAEHTEHAADLADAFDLLEADDFVKTGPRTGKPKVGAVKDILEREVAAEEIDAAWAARETAAA